MRVALVSSLSGWGGGEKWFLEAATALRDRGHEVRVVGRPDSELLRRAAERGLRGRSVDMHGIGDPRALWSMGRMLRSDRIEIAIVNQSREMRLVGLSAPRHRGFRLVVRRGSPDPIKDDWHFRWFYRHRVDRLLLNCEALRPKVLRHAPWFDESRVTVLHNGIDAEDLRARASAARGRRAYGVEPGVPVVVLVGEIGWRKDQATLLRAIARLRDRRPDLRAVFALVGDGAERPVLEELARSLGLGPDRVRWMGFRPDVPDLLAAADLVVLPTREEGFPNTLLEAMALERCVLATPVDGIVELIEDRRHGRLTPVGDPRALAAGLEELLGDEELRSMLGKAGRERVERDFDQQRIMDRLEALLLETLKSDATAPGSAGRG